MSVSVQQTEDNIGNESDHDPLNDESTFKTSLARLQEVHIALRHLRQILPSLIETTRSPSTPEDLYADFGAAAQRAGKQIQDFTAILQDEKTRDILEKARNSRDEDTEVGCWKVADHPDWLVVDKKSAIVKTEEKEGKDVMDVDGKGEEDVKELVEHFSRDTEGVTASLDAGSGRVKVELLQPANMVFEIETSNVNGDEPKYHVKAASSSKLQDGIVEAVNARRHGRGIGYLLDLLASYKDVKRRPCDKCSRLIDKGGMFPVVRTEKSQTQPVDNKRREWQAWHRLCI